MTMSWAKTTWNTSSPQLQTGNPGRGEIKKKRVNWAKYVMDNLGNSLAPFPISKLRLELH
jgi:uncharacterized Rossmann fold enzyme